MTLAEARKALGWSPEQLAEQAGESASNVRDLEAGRNRRPAYVLVMRIVKALQRGGLAGITPEEIFPVPLEPAKVDRRTRERRKAVA